ncbi:MAG: hypothetical protein DSY80_07150 [Desulfocapsa sp.]|nr:MAG: hypothetical protein DSY80_07150 [Desulfocapsa sp.]
MVKLIFPSVVLLALTGCSHTPREMPELPLITKPSSAAARVAELSDSEVAYLKKDKTGKVIGRKFDKNKRNLTQSNRWITWRHSNDWFWHK